ncbi:MAG TPA: hypothetical protein VJ742_10105 [Nitrososphaera sp.]|nr:hypothetical protein [Nitrososphaera sp.]
MLVNLLSTAGGVLLGCLMSWYASRFYYKKSSDELVKEAARLRHLSTIMLSVMENAGLAKLNRAKSGEIVGQFIELSATFVGATEMCGELQMTHSGTNGDGT